MSKLHLLLVVSVAVVVALSCRVTTMTRARPSAVSGCDMVHTDDGDLHCHLPASAKDHELVLWLEGRELQDPEVTLVSWRRESLPVVNDFMGTGTRLVVRVDHPGVLEVTGSIVEPEIELAVRRTWTLELERRPASPRLDAIVARWHASTDPSNVDEILEDLHALAIMAPRWQAAKAWALRGEILRRAQRPLDALDAFEQAVHVAGAEELSLRCWLVNTIAELHLVDREDHHAAGHALELPGCEVLGLAHQAPRAALLGTLAFREGRLEEAIDQLERAAEGGHRLRLPRVGVVAAAQLAVAQARAQRFDAAAQTLSRARALADALDVDCEDRLALVSDALLVATEDPRDRELAVAGVMPGLEGALAECSASASVRALSVLGIAYALQQGGYEDQALRWLDLLDHRMLRPQQRMYEASIRADVAMAQEDWFAAAAAADELARLVDRHPHESTPELEVQREYVRGRVDMAHDQRAQAVRHLELAMRLQEDQLRLVPLGLSASRVSARDADPGRALVEVQRQQGDLEAALCTARLLRNRAGRMLFDAARLYDHDRTRYERLVTDVRRKELAFQAADMGSDASVEQAKVELLAAQRALVHALARAAGLADYEPRSLCAALPEPAPGELALLFHRDRHGGWWQFEWSHDEPVRVHEVGSGDPAPTDDPQRMAERWLHPALDRLEHESRIRLLTEGATNAIVFEALPWQGDSLEQRFAVTWGLDLPLRPELELDWDDAIRPVLVYTDHYHHFDRMRPRVDAVREAVVRTWGPHVPMLVDEEASTSDLQSLSGRAAPLIFIDHNSAVAELDADNPDCHDSGSSSAFPTDPPPLELELELDPGPYPKPNPDRPTPGLWINRTSVGPGTLLTLDPPRVAILESCATGPIEELSLDGTVGLGHVLVAAGTRQVLATRRKVCPDQALDFLRTLVEAAASEPLDLPSLLRAARHADPDYLHRVLVP